MMEPSNIYALARARTQESIERVEKKRKRTKDTYSPEAYEEHKAKTLTLPLKRKWFDLIKAGIKKEEYRKVKAKYLEMFCTQYEDHTEHALPNHSNDFKVSFHLLWPEQLQEKFNKIVFTLGYPKSDDAEHRLEFNNPKIHIGEGKPEWGAEPGKKYFVITWEE